ncbi:Lysophospholipid acyltransferase 1 [Bagarius yarrelli]|uniref:Lysophospholipid acyltransferase 1 n=1 Tax=Bagarius yarrelli TaxID=175774 RepID=A0A556TUU3_BAGYA|nr:Lysophospholipid acyltransferase 1 [Bagarius yarrelli]
MQNGAQIGPPASDYRLHVAEAHQWVPGSSSGSGENPGEVQGLELVNFIMCQMFGLAAACCFRLCLSPQRVGPAVRHAVASFLGSMFIIFCFGWYSSHVFILTLVCYVILNKASANTVHWLSMLLAMGYLTLCQISRVFIFNYGILATDFSGPLMMLVQKITTLAFQFHDGTCHKREELTAEQRRLAVASPPSLLEYLSYTLNFMSVLVGPWSSFRDYVEFIEGRHVHNKLKVTHNGYSALTEPSPTRAMIQKLMVCVGCLLWFFMITRRFPISYNVDPHFISEASFLRRLAYTFVSVQAARPKFYFAWTLDFSYLQTATSFKSFIDNWNIQTGVWLKRYKPVLSILFTVFYSEKPPAMTCLADEYERGGFCCKKCPKGTRVASNCNQTSETKCEPCPANLYMDFSNYVEKCFYCKACSSSKFQHHMTNIRHPTSDTQHQTPNIRHPASDTQHPTPASDTRIRHPASDTQHQTPSIRHPTSDTQHYKVSDTIYHILTSNIRHQLPEPKLRTPPSNIRHQPSTPNIDLLH